MQLILRPGWLKLAKEREEDSRKSTAHVAGFTLRTRKQYAATHKANELLQSAKFVGSSEEGRKRGKSKRY